MISFVENLKLMNVKQCLQLEKPKIPIKYFLLNFEEKKLDSFMKIIKINYDDYTWKYH